MLTLLLTLMLWSFPPESLRAVGPAQSAPAPALSAPAAPLYDEPISLPAILYPAEARRARIQGSVQLEVTVDPSGRVVAVHALSGPIPLREAAVNAYSGARYRPLANPKDGRPTPAIVSTAVNFTLNELPPDTDQLVDAKFQPLHAHCQELSRARDDEALAACRKALDMAHNFSPSAALEARASAVNDLVLVLLARKNYEEAAAVAGEAVALVAAADHAHTPAVATAYITRCEARSLAKDFDGAAEDCAVAEETLTTLIADQRAPEESKSDRTANLKTQLRETLELHAIVLEKSHHPTEASHLRSRAKLV